MKVRITVATTRAIEVDHPVFQKMADLYDRDPMAIADDDDIKKAIEEIERVTGIPFNNGHPTSDNIPTIDSVYTMDGEALLEA